MAGSTTTDDAPGSGAADRSGLRADHRNTWNGSIRGKHIGSYLGLIPSEESSGGRQRLDTSASKATRCCAFCWWKRHKRRTANQDWRQKYWHLAMCREKSIAKVALARQFGRAVVLDVAERLRVCAVVRVRFARGQLGTGHGVQVKRRPLYWASRSLVRQSSHK